MIVFGLLSSVFDILTFITLRLGFHASATLFEAVELLAGLVCQVCVRDLRAGPALWAVGWENAGMGYNFAGGVLRGCVPPGYSRAMM